MNQTRKTELAKILNTAPFGSPEWEAASKELREIRAKEDAKAPLNLGKKWCSAYGEWWF